MLTSSPSTSLRHPRRTYRIAVSATFLLQGLCFSTWAARIPTVQQQLGLSDTELGGVLLAVPVGSMASLPLSGWLVARYGSRQLTLLGLFLYAAFLPLLGLATSVPVLLGALVLFGLASNMANISINTQAVGVEALYGKSIMARFHGLWSLAGFAGAAIGSFMISHAIAPLPHFLLIAAVVIGGLLIARPFLLPADAPREANAPIFVLPDKSLLLLGVLAFCSLLCEGTMFDWSGVYFRKVVQADKDLVGVGFAAFMSTMAAGRFVADWFTDRFGRQRTLVLSGLLEALGLALAVLLPGVVPATVGFMLVGLGVSSVVPLVYGAAGRSKTMSPGVALAAVSTVGFAGFLLGPPVIGLVAGATSLRVSFGLIALMGLAVAGLARRAEVE
ncbi:MFS family permease [Hymenobacter luteus]|uniref:MFS family permease n=2 Tax=Hymenobacter TaxID=89966 RepID=A0A7W9T087_9BACT|nr:MULTISPECIES: MFS transporter [Hymenobacter]MBB4601485.1 MFS family permease [Hymenobacter latericoloratus]MBB6058308.1 MFS family permease [Hymenobacter luteus]